MRTRAPTTAVLVCLATGAVAQTADGPCPTTTGDALTACLSAHYSELDRLLASTYKAAVAGADRSGLGRNLTMDWKRALQEAQRKWISFREADCGPPITYERARAPVATATAQLRCRIEHTQARLAALLQRYPAP